MTSSSSAAVLVRGGWRRYSHSGIRAAATKGDPNIVHQEIKDGRSNPYHRCASSLSSGWSPHDVDSSSASLFLDGIRNHAVLGKPNFLSIKPSYSTLLFVIPTATTIRPISTVMTTKRSLVSRLSVDDSDSPPEELASADDFSSLRDMGGGGVINPNVDDGDTASPSNNDADADADAHGRKPSPLSRLPEGYTPGQALLILQNKGAKGRMIRRTEMNDLCHAARPGWEKDAKVIRTALSVFKRCSKFILLPNGAKIAIDGMIRSMLQQQQQQQQEGPNDVNGWGKTNAALFVLDAFCDVKTGLYYATEIEDIDRVLQLLLEGVREEEKEGLQLSTNNKSATSDDEEGAEETVEDDRAQKILSTTKSAIALLIRRGEHPDSEMKKRAQRRYRKLIKVVQGPHQSTIHLATQVCLEIGGPDVAQEMIIDPFMRRTWPKFPPFDETLELIRLAREQKEMEETKGVAVAAVENGDEEGLEDEMKENEEDEQANEGKDDTTDDLSSKVDDEDSSTNVDKDDAKKK